MTLLLGSFTLGLILSLLALGVYISFRIFDFADLTTEGSITVGAAVSAVLLVKGVNPLAATLAGSACGALSGMVTGILHTRFNIHRLLSGILVTTALYSINLRIMGRSNVPLMDTNSLIAWAEHVGLYCAGGRSSVSLLGWNVAIRDLSAFTCAIGFLIFLCAMLYAFFRTNLGTAMRATGNNDQMIRALGVNTGNMVVAGLALANGLVGLAGALMAQYQGFADVQMGIGMVVWGLASVIIGEALVRSRNLALTIIGAVMGSVLFRLLVAIALRWGMNPNDLKLVTAAFVFAALVLPSLLNRFRPKESISHA